MPIYVPNAVDDNPEQRSQGIENITSTPGERTEAFIGESIPVQAGMALNRFTSPPAPSPLLQPDEANKQYGIENQLKFSAPVQADVANDMNTAKMEEMKRKDVLARSPSGITPAVTNFGLAMVTDPLNIAAAFIPFGGEARMASIAGKIGLDASTVAGRTAIRAGVGAYQGAAMQIPLDAMRYGLSQANNEDFTAGDALRDIAYGALFQGAVHAGIGGLHEGYVAGKDYLTEKFNSSPHGELVNNDFPTRDLAARASITAMAEGRPIQIDPILQEKIKADAPQLPPEAAPTTGGLAPELHQRLHEEFGDYLDPIKKALEQEMCKENTAQIIRNYMETIEKAEAHPPTAAIETPEREALRKDIEKTMIMQKGFANPDAAPEGQIARERRADIVLGPPASGKSSVLAEPLAREHQSRLLDNDEIKKMLPEYEKGTGAHRVHEESSKINQHITEKAIRAGENIVLPKIGKTLPDMLKLVKTLKDEKYQVHAHLVHAPPEVTIPRAMFRYAKENRAIPAKYLRSIGNSPEATYEALKGEAHGYTKIDNSGRSPRVIEQVGNSRNPERKGAGGERGSLRPGSDRGGALAGNGKESGRGSSAAASEIIKLPGKADTAVTPAGREIGVRYGVVEGNDLVASQLDDGRGNPDYPRTLQPRDRSRFSSQQQIAKIANTLNPKLLMENPLTSEGSPIIGKDGVVESGNGRVLAIRKAYNEGLPGAERYRQALEAAGYDVSGLQNPVLIRQRETPMTEEERIGFTQESNQRTTASMSATEQAMTDAKHLSEGVLDRFTGGDIKLGKNRDFIRAAIKEVIPENEHASVFTKDGELSQEAERRLTSALLAKAYGDESILRLLTESTDNELTSLGKALTFASPLWARMREAAAKGTITPEVDITGELVDAVKLILRARREGKPISDFTSTQDMFGAQVSPNTQKLLALFHTNDKMTRFRAVDKISEDLSYYAREAEKAKPGENLFGEGPSKSSDIIDTLYKKAFGNEQGPAQENLFQSSLRAPVENAGERGGGDGGRGGKEPLAGGGEPGQGSDASLKPGSIQDVKDYVLGKADPNIQAVIDKADSLVSDTTPEKQMAAIQQEIADMESAIKNSQEEGRLGKDIPELQDVNDLVKAAEARSALYESLAQCMETEIA